MEVAMTTGAIGRAKLQSNLHHQQTNTQFFYMSHKRSKVNHAATGAVFLGRLPKVDLKLL